MERELKALANRRRLEVLRYLRDSGRVKVSDIAYKIKISLPATSRHLIMLESAGILEKEQVSLEVFYYLSSRQRSHVREIISIC